MLCIIIDYYFVIMYLKIDLSMNGLDVSVHVIESNDVLEASQYYDIFALMTLALFASVVIKVVRFSIFDNRTSQAV